MPDRRVALASFAVFVLLVIVALVSFRPAPTPSPELTPAPALLGVDAAAITRVEVHSAEGDLILDKTSGAWQIVSPVQSAADGVTIDGLLTTLASLAIDRTLGSDVDLAEFGLDPITTTIALTVAGDEPMVIEVGSTNPDETKRYVRVEGDTDVHLVYTYQLDRLIAMVTAPPLPPTPTPEASATASVTVTTEAATPAGEAVSTATMPVVATAASESEATATPAPATVSVPIATATAAPTGEMGVTSTATTSS